MPAPLRKIFCINPSFKAPPRCITRTLHTVRYHTDGPNILAPLLPHRKFRNGNEITSLFSDEECELQFASAAPQTEAGTLNAEVILSPILSAPSKSVNRFKRIMKDAVLAYFNPQSDVPCIRRFDPG